MSRAVLAVGSLLMLLPPPAAAAPALAVETRPSAQAVRRWLADPPRAYATALRWVWND